MYLDTYLTARYLQSNENVLYFKYILNAIS